MTNARLPVAAILLYCVTSAHAQSAATVVPKLVRFSGSFCPANGLPTQRVESATLSMYADQTGGNALWQEVQNVSLDAEGHYSVLMGATQNDGMPLELFSSREPRWLGVQFNRPGETEQPRVLLASVPYALKAADADTLGGKPASAYLLASAPAGSTATTSAAPSTAIATSVKPRATAGTAGYIGVFVDPTDLGNSVMYQNGGNIGIGTTSPGISLDVRTGPLPQMGIAGTSDYLTFFASDTYGPAIYWDPAKDMRFGRGGASLYNPYGFTEQMRIESSTGNVGIGTQTPGSKLDVAGNIDMSGSLLYQGSMVLQVPGGSSNGNIGLGPGALASNTSGTYNTAIGNGALVNNFSGEGNTATGEGALGTNYGGDYNTAIGYGALQYTANGSNNIAIGPYARLKSLERC